MTIYEKEVLESLKTTWNLFLGLEKQHPNERSDFANGIHQCQNVIAMRLAREHYPEIFPIKK